MGSPHPKKHELVRAAVRLFAENGFDGTTTLRIAKAAGVTEPLIYGSSLFHVGKSNSSLPAMM